MFFILNLKKTLTFIIFLIVQNVSFAQSNDFLLKRSQQLIIDENYSEADSILKEIINTIDTIPSELTFLFGKNSFHLNKFKQSINWLNKYIELKGMQGIFSEEAIKYLELSNTKNIVAKKKDTKNVIIELFSYRYIECPNKFKLCPICKGSSVMITETNIGKIYKTCPFSDDKGFLTCDQYNDFLRGKLLPKKNIN